MRVVLLASVAALAFSASSADEHCEGLQFQCTVQTWRAGDGGFKPGFPGDSDFERLHGTHENVEIGASCKSERDEIANIQLKLYVAWKNLVAEISREPWDIAVCIAPQ